MSPPLYICTDPDFIRDALPALTSLAQMTPTPNTTSTIAVWNNASH